MFIQGGATGTIKIPMAYVLQALQPYKLRYLPLPQIHDELDFVVHPDDVELFTIIVTDFMANATSLGAIPIQVEVEVGETWGETVPYRTITGSFQTEYGGVNEQLLATVD